MITLEFQDMEDVANPYNGAKVSAGSDLIEILNLLRNRPPFFLQLIGNHGYKLDVGIGRAYGCAQYSSNDGNPPYLMAVNPTDGFATDVEFLAGGTPTPIDKRHILSWDLTVQVAQYFLETGKQLPVVDWEEI